jgi:hypothetical protein
MTYLYIIYTHTNALTCSDSNGVIYAGCFLFSVQSFYIIIYPTKENIMWIRIKENKQQRLYVVRFMTYVYIIKSKEIYFVFIL